ncbi:thiosulfate dehydrogenase [quinone] large subunit [Pustulibacterium marinum]|uniref:Thiosulfate dehydrogenase [quinone] large subunit n=1 Tax=Pustulibacterium marinum TaxID=1224947 RepID=A0A1I7I2C1_9FLAO|nr:TQO small subunit DoxD [Pustulibacterium marinum]SFU67073.1 thiosulfate dehydrogenase [quinone] large subunit [Pustulibacterium marinum]
MMHTLEKNTNFSQAGLFTLSLRVITGYTYFSAFWRRTVLMDKLDPDLPGYIGVKFNHFLPHALGIKGLIEYLLTHPEALWYNMVIFTIIEGVVGLFLLLGCFTRLASIGTFALAMGILLGSGWLGTTCVDEWQIGILGLAAGSTLFFTGSGTYSLDQRWIQQSKRFTTTKWFAWLGSGTFPMPAKKLQGVVALTAISLLLIAGGTHQHFHGGVWGTLHNKSIRPTVELSEVGYANNTLSFNVFRTHGVDVYGSFLIGIQIQDAAHNTVMYLDGTMLATFPKAQIKNHYIAKVAPGKHSLIIPLGAKATITLPMATTMSNTLPEGTYTLTLTDISGAEWTTNFTI